MFRFSDATVHPYVPRESLSTQTVLGCCDDEGAARYSEIYCYSETFVQTIFEC